MTDRAAEIRSIDLRDGGDPVEVRIRRDRRSRSIRIHVSEHGDVQATVPMRFRVAELDDVVIERAAWLRTALHTASHAAAATRISLHDGGPVRHLGVWYPVRVDNAGRAHAYFDDGRITIACTESDDAYEVLNRWYRGEARRVIEERIAVWAPAIGVGTGRISIRDQRTRWGSCTANGDLSFNFRLVMAPLWVLDAIVVHELCHIVELNHSEAFWSLLDGHYPRHREAQQWLERHGSTLHVTRPDDADVANGDAAAATVMAAATTSAGASSMPSLF